MKSIRAQLLTGLFWAALATGVAAGAVLYAKAHREATELADLQLRQIAIALPDHLVPDLEKAVAGEPEEVVYIRAWDARGRAIYASEGAPKLPRQARTGFVSLALDDTGWRSYTFVEPGRTIEVSQPDAIRLRLAAHLVWHLAAPMLFFLPLFGALVYVVVGRALRPLERMAQAVAGRSPNALQPLDAGPLSPELQPIQAALNALFAQIEGAMAAQRRFVADAAHELRSPLTALKLQLQLVQRASGETAREQAFIKLHERLDRASHLVQQMLTLARHEAGNAGPKLAEVDLHALARQVVADHSAYADSRDIDLGLSPSAGAVLAVRGDVDGLGVMLGNLVDNALRYTPPGGQVDVSAAVEDGRPLLRVTDNGPGVAPADRARLFDRFYRPDGNLVWGCGLGMSIVKNIADLHGAEVRLDDGLAGRDGAGLAVTVRFAEPA
jgi:two-component system OmpR family sensor kinase